MTALRPAERMLMELGIERPDQIDLEASAQAQARRRADGIRFAQAVQTAPAGSNRRADANDSFGRAAYGRNRKGRQHRPGIDRPGRVAFRRNG